MEPGLNNMRARSFRIRCSTKVSFWEGRARAAKSPLLDLDPPPAFDSSSWTRRITSGTLTPGPTGRSGASDNAEAVVLLSATPIQLGDNDLFTLLQLVRPDLLPSRRDFDHMAEPNPHINAAIEITRNAQPGGLPPREKDSRWPWDSLGILGPVSRCSGPTAPRRPGSARASNRKSPDGRERLRVALHLCADHQMDASTRHRQFHDTKARDGFRRLHGRAGASAPSGVLDLVARILAHRHGDRNLQFMMTTIRRQVASCVFGLAPYLEAILSGQLTRLELSETDSEDGVQAMTEAFAEFRADVDALVRLAKGLEFRRSKFSAFAKVVLDKQALANNKLLVFSTFRHTLAYLVDKLQRESIRMGKAVTIHGDVPETPRTAQPIQPPEG